MSLSISPLPRFRAWYPAGSTVGAAGSPLNGGYLYTAQPGTNVQFGISPSYPQTTYTDSTGLTQNPNPIILDGNGECDLWLTTFTKLVLFDSQGNLIWSRDNVSSNPALTPSTLQWVPQGTQVSFISATSFSLSGNYTGIFQPGTAVQATITGGNIYGITQSSSYGGTPGITTVTVAWFSTALNLSVSAVAAGILTPQGSGSALPVYPAQQFSANATANAAGLFQIWEANSANAISFTLPAANSVPSGSFYDIFNAGSALLTVVGTVNGSANQTLTPLTGERIISDGTNWWTWPGSGQTPGVLALSNATNLSLANAYRQIVASNAANLTLPAANSVPSGLWYDIFNSGASNATVIGTVNGSANLVLAQYAGKRVFSDATSWWAR